MVSVSWRAFSRYFLVVTALDQQSTCCAVQLLRAPLQHRRQTVLEQLLRCSYSLSGGLAPFSSQSGQRVSWDLMDSMLSLLSLDAGGFLSSHIFLYQLPPPELPCSPGDFGDLTEEAHKVLLSSRRFSVQSVATDTVQLLVVDADQATSGWCMATPYIF